MMLLALDASGHRCSAALLDGEDCIARMEGGDSRSAAASLSGLVNQLLGRHSQHLSSIGVAVGPGSFTGLRASIALAHGLSIGAGVPIAGVTVAEALLAELPAEPPWPVWVALDARRPGRIFLCRDAVVTAELLDTLPLPPGPVLVIGDAADATVAALRRAGATALAGSPQVVNPVQLGRVAWRRLAGSVPPCAVMPLYVAAPEARAAAALRPTSG